MFILPVMDDETFLFSDRCVFCKKHLPDNEAREEHILPYYLNGTWILKKGSCTTCANFSNDYYENSSSNTSFLSIRIFLGLKRRKKSNLKLYPKSASGERMRAERESFNIDLGDKRPNLFTIPVFSPPGLLQNKLLIEPEMWRIVVLNFDSREYKAEIVSSLRSRNSGKFSRKITAVRTHIVADGIEVTYDDEHDIDALMLQVAKIGYCYAVGRLGFNAFDGRDVRRLLRGYRNDIASFVGGAPLEETYDTKALHKVYLKCRGHLLTAVVHLFGSMNCFPYEVVLGRYRESRSDGG